MNRESTRKRRVQKTLGLHYSRFYVIALCIDSRFRHKILENCSQAARVEKVGLIKQTCGQSGEVSNFAQISLSDCGESGPSPTQSARAFNSIFLRPHRTTVGAKGKHMRFQDAS